MKILSILFMLASLGAGIWAVDQTVAAMARATAVMQSAEGGR